MSRRTLIWVTLALLVLVGACSKNDNPAPTEPPITPPRTPSNLYVPAIGVDRISLAWTDNSETEIGFRIERRDTPEGSFARVDTVAQNRTRYTDRTVQANGTYAYRIIAYKVGSESVPSNVVTIQAVANQSPTIPSSPSPPDGANEIDPESAVTLTWSSYDPDGEPVVYDVYFGATLGQMTQVSERQSDSTYVVNPPFERNNHYFWRVVVHDTKGVTRPSPLWGFNTVVDREIVPEGLFVMGEHADSSSIFFHPGNPVFTLSYSIDRYLVTNQQYADFLNQALDRKMIRLVNGLVTDPTGAFVWAEIRPLDLDSDLSFSVADSVFTVLEGRERFPIVEVSWYGADAYATYYGRSLPTEARWEKAAKGTSDELGVFTTEFDTVGVGYPYPWGEEIDLARGNFLNSGDPYENLGRVRSTPVGFYNGEVQSGYPTKSGLSPFGVDDMAGNVWEWCNDWYGLYRSPHRPPNAGHFKIIRGGSYNKPYGSAMTWNRSYIGPSTTDRAVGFRTVGAVR